MRHHVRATLIMTALAVAFFAAQGQAEAKRGIAIFNTGEDLFEAGPLPAPFDKMPQSEGWKAGYRCSIFGLFWIYFAWWDCKPVAIKDDSYNDDATIVKAIAAKYTTSDIKPGFWKGYMRWVLLVIVLGFVGFFVWGMFSKDDDEDELAPETGAPPDQED